jgi:hypothetical protein
MKSVTNKPFMLSAIMLNVIMLNVIMLNVIMLSVIMLNVIIMIVVLLSTVTSICHCRVRGQRYKLFTTVSYDQIKNMLQ